MSAKTQEDNYANPVQDGATAALHQSQLSPSPVETGRTASPKPDTPQVQRPLRIYTYSSFLCWWPVWVVEYVMAFLTYWHGKPQQIEAIGQAREWIHPSSNLGVVFFLVLFLVILITNFSMRGLASGIVIMGGAC